MPPLQAFEVLENLIALFAAALPLMGSPGPVTLASAAAGAAYGRRRAAIYVVTMTAGTLTVISMVAAGLTGLIFALPGAAPVLAVLAALYMLYLAWKIATAPPLGGLDGGAPPPALWGWYAMAVANPKAYAAFIAVFSGYPLLEDQPVVGTVLKVAVLGCLALSVNLTWMVLGASLATLMQSPTASRALNIGFAVLLVASVALSFLG